LKKVSARFEWVSFCLKSVLSPSSIGGDLWSPRGATWDIIAYFV